MGVCRRGGDCVYGDGGGSGSGGVGDVFNGISDCRGGCSHYL